MKLILAILLFCLSFGDCFAQQTQVATLERGETTVAVFYGVNALTSAYSESKSGDIITLSEGKFTAPSNIEKGLTIYGVGYLTPDGKANGQTVITGDLRINGSAADKIHMEGIAFGDDIFIRDGNKNLSLFRCSLKEVWIDESQYCSIVECYVQYLNISSSSDCMFVKSITPLKLTIAFSSSIRIENNILLEEEVNYPDEVLNFTGSKLVTVKNNVFLAKDSDELWGKTNCREVKLENNLFIMDPLSSEEEKEYESFQNNYIEEDYVGNTLFVNYDKENLLYQQDFHLTNDKWIGTDGTTVGIYGTNSPFKEMATPTTPLVVKAEVGATTNSQGQLSVDIAVEAQTK